MKKFLGFLKNRADEYEYEEDWDGVEDMEYSDEEYDDEDYEFGEYEEEAYEPEEYTGEEYESELYEDEEYETESYECGEYVGEEYENEGYECEEYETEEYEEAAYSSQEDFYEAEEYEDGEDPELEYYAEDASDEAQYYSEEELDLMEEDDWQEPVPVNFFEKIRYAFVNMDMTDRIIACTGVGVLILALVTGSVFAGTKLTNRQVNSFASVGTQLDGITVIGGDGLMAVADAQMAKQEAADLVGEEQQEESKEYEEAEYSKEVTVSLNMTSIKKDLKIKFVNKKTGKLIPNVPFEVTVTDPNGKKSTWKDEDKDGIIYKTEIKPGKYSIAMNALTGYDDYKISTEAQNVKVKENLDYEKVDVSDEIKTEAEVDASKEDTAKNDMEEESRLQDTVAWVESTKTPIDETYTEISKSTIDEPKQARFDNFMKLAGTNGESVSISGGGNVGTEASVYLSASTSGFEGKVSYQWSVSSPDGVTASLSGTNESSTTLTVKNTTSSAQTVTVSVTASSSVQETVSGSTTDKQYSDTASTTITVAAGQSATATISKSTLSLAVGGSATLTAKSEGDTAGFTWSSSNPEIAAVSSAGVVTGKKAGTAVITATHANGSSAACTVTVTETEITIKLNKTSATVNVKKTIELVPTVTGSTNTESKVTWSSSNTAVATVTGDNRKATVTGVKAGDVTITASFTENNETVTATCTVKVQNGLAADTTTALKDKSGNQVYVKNAQGQYAAATYADYFKENQKFYIRQQGYKYTGWQTIDGKVYYFDANGNKVTGAQVIQGVQYNFDSNGVLVSSNGILGIDVSKWNGSIDWNAVKNSGVSYVIIRCGYRGSSQGSLIEDPRYRSNIQGATAAGLKVGVYFFTQAVNEIEAVEEASMVLSLVKGYKLSYPIFLDVESSGGRADGISRETRTAVCKAFCQTIKNSGYAAGVYANKTWFTNYIDAGQLGAYRIWLAQYASAPTYAGRYDIWQYSSKGKIGGISGNVDMNLSYMGY